MNAENSFTFKDVSCSNCGNAIRVCAPLVFHYLTCPSCGKILSRDETYDRISVYGKSLNKRIRYHQKPLIETGTFATIKGEAHYVAGYSVLKEEGKKYKWAEYLMYNSAGETVVLSEYLNCYQLIKRVPIASEDFTEVDEYEVNYKRGRFHLYNKYTIEPLDIKGEIPYPIFEPTAAAKYIAPPEILIINKMEGKDPVYFMGRFIGRRELKKAFGKEFPYAEIVSPTKTVLGGFAWRGALLIFACFMLLSYLAQTLISNINPPKEKFSRNYTVHRDGTPAIVPAEFVSPGFTLQGTASNLYLQFTAAHLSNDWYEGSVTLVNETTNQELTAFFTGEYYSGYDGEHWSEGSRTATVMLSNLSPGYYHLVTSFELSPSMQQNDFFVSVTEDERMESNFWFLILITGIVTVGLLAWNGMLDYNRWTNSDYSPYD